MLPRLSPLTAVWFALWPCPDCYISVTPRHSPGETLGRLLYLLHLYLAPSKVIDASLPLNDQEIKYLDWNLQTPILEADRPELVPKDKNATDQLCILCIFDVLELMKHYLVFITWVHDYKMNS